jgi:hypothetical protein
MTATKYLKNPRSERYRQKQNPQASVSLKIEPQRKTPEILDAS